MSGGKTERSGAQARGARIPSLPLAPPPAPPQPFSLAHLRAGRAPAASCPASRSSRSRRGRREEGELRVRATCPAIAAGASSARVDRGHGAAQCSEMQRSSGNNSWAVARLRQATRLRASQPFSISTTPRASPAAVPARRSAGSTALPALQPRESLVHSRAAACRVCGAACRPPACSSSSPGGTCKLSPKQRARRSPAAAAASACAGAAHSCLPPPPPSSLVAAARRWQLTPPPTTTSMWRW